MAVIEPQILAVESSERGAVPRPHLAFLDGIRGLTALYVVLGHTLLHFPDASKLSQPARWATALLRYPHSAVCVFIVLSGFCLMLPIANVGELRGGILKFIQRRGHRLLPPYYIAFILSLCLALAYPLSGKSLVVPGSTGVSSLLIDESTARNISPIAKIGSHLLLLHNLNSGTATSINSPMWSVATEWQIYFCFAIILIPLSRKVGTAILVPLGILIGVAPTLVLHGSWDQRIACFWMIGLFAMGMVAAEAWVRGRLLIG